MIRRFICILTVIICSLHSFSQIGGEHTYEFLNLTNSARMGALGGNQVALNDSVDLNIAYNNPSLLSPYMDKYLTFSYVSYFADIKYGYASYSFKTPLPGNTAIGMHYINYGTFDEALSNGERTGSSFKAAEYALSIIYSNTYKQFSYGVAIKPLYSSFETYQSFGLAADLGISYFSKDNLTTAAFVLKNIGTQISKYYEQASREPIPFDVQMGISQKLKYAPIRLAATLQHLQDWDLSYVETEVDEYTTQKNDNLLQSFMRHMVFGVELLPSPNFTLRAGYNYQRRQELKFDQLLSTVGFSWGFGIKISRFQINYGSARYHLAGSSNHISIALNLGEQLK